MPYRQHIHVTALADVAAAAFVYIMPLIGQHRVVERIFSGVAFWCGVLPGGIAPGAPFDFGAVFHAADALNLPEAAARPGERNLLVKLYVEPAVQALFPAAGFKLPGVGKSAPDGGYFQARIAARKGFRVGFQPGGHLFAHEYAHPAALQRRYFYCYTAVGDHSLFFGDCVQLIGRAGDCRKQPRRQHYMFPQAHNLSKIQKKPNGT